MLSLYNKLRLFVLVIFLFTIACGYWATDLKITFNFEQFFPENDPDLEYYKKFTAEFEKDDNFLLIAVKNNEKSVYDTSFLKKINSLTDSLFSIQSIQKVQSLTNLKTPVKTPFGYTLLPTLHINDGEKLREDIVRIQNDERFKNNFINDKGNALAILIKTNDDLSMNQNDSLIKAVKTIIINHNIPEENYHFLGKSFFQTELVRLQKEEVFISTIISAILVFIILYLIFGSLLTSFLAMTGIGVSLIIFMGILSVMGRELSVMSALYPVLILIVGSSDVIHLISKYLDYDITEENKTEVMVKVVKQVGMATFLTSATTAVGFVSLLTSQLKVIRDFGINAGLGVMIAYVVVMILIPVLLLLFKKEQLFKKSYSSEKINDFALSAYKAGLNKSRQILAVLGILILICFYGISKISTDYKLITNLPKGERVTNDFLYFEKEFSGFRPFEVAVVAKEPYKINDYEIVKSIDGIENKLKSYDAIRSSISISTIFKSLNMLENGNSRLAYKLPDSLEAFNALLPLFNKVSKNEFNILVNKENTASRISCKIKDVGADNIKSMSLDFDKWLTANIDTSKLEVRRTGTSMILDKNGEYITKNIFQGLLLSILLISILMSLIVKSWKMLIVSLIPNIIPLIFAAALLGYFGIELEAGISIIFAVIFGIAVDDTIHFIARYNQCLATGLNVEQSIEQTFKDTGRALVVTTIILFFGFLVMLFSKHPTSVIVGSLIAFTLVSALLCDLYLLPILIRKVFGKSQSKI